MAVAKTFVVIGATGEVGSGITSLLVERGHSVIAVARNSERLDALASELGTPANLSTVSGSLESDISAAALREAVLSIAPEIAGVAITVNGARRQVMALQASSEDFAALVNGDLVTHYTAIRAFLPAIDPAGALVGIGGGSADFILGGGVYMSTAQGGLRQLYRGIGFELPEGSARVMELVVASVVNSASTREGADPLWVTETEIGAQVAAMLEQPTAYPETVWRISRRVGNGTPPITTDPIVPYVPLPPQALASASGS